jgi:hypothetical protein
LAKREIQVHRGKEAAESPIHHTTWINNPENHKFYVRRYFLFPVRLRNLDLKFKSELLSKSQLHVYNFLH